MPDNALTDPLKSLAYLHGEPLCRGLIREKYDDFYVEEVLSFAPSGSGEHAMFWVEKRGANTEWVAKQLARHCGVGPAKASWAGLKDRHAVTKQWIGVHLPGVKGIDTYPEHEQFRVLEHRFNNRKLRTGAISRNLFRLRLRYIQYANGVNQEALEQRLSQIRSQGVPNYFGVQRFGHHNLDRAQAMLVDGVMPRKRMDQTMAISAARSYLFNHVLSQRLSQGLWHSLMNGDAIALDQSRSHFNVNTETLADTLKRIESHDCHPSAPLVGMGSTVTDDAEQWETECLQTHQQWYDGLKRLKVQAARRAARVVLQDFTWQWQDDDLVLSFALPSGAFATAVLREFIDVDDASVGHS